MSHNRNRGDETKKLYLVQNVQTIGKAVIGKKYL